MGFKERGVRRGDGPFRDSWQRKNVGVGKREQAGEPCPQKPQKEQPSQPEKK